MAVRRKVLFGYAGIRILGEPQGIYTKCMTRAVLFDFRAAVVLADTCFIIKEALT